MVSVDDTSRLCKVNVKLGRTFTVHKVSTARWIQKYGQQIRVSPAGQQGKNIHL